MTLKEVLLAEYDAEVAATRRVLERLPERAFAWKPHDKSMSLGDLALHLADIPRWGASILERDGYDLRNGSSGARDEASSRESILGRFDRHTAGVRVTLLEKTDAELAAPWKLTSGDELVMSMPRLSALRRFLLSHLIHHRGQLTIYLRMHDVPLPPLYGPTADESM